MQASLPDELGAFVRARVAAATRDKSLYDRNGARLNGQLLQGEINFGSAVLAWLESHRPGIATDAEDGEPSEEDTVAGNA